MNKKYKTYILLTLVLLVWGTVVYKIIKGINPEQTEISAYDSELNFNPKKIEKPDTFSIQTVDRDPFLGTLTRNQSTKTTNRSGSKNQNNTLNLPRIKYHGLVQTQNSTQQIFVVSVNGNQHLLKRGQTADGVKLIRGDAKKIAIRFNNQQLTISLQ